MALLKRFFKERIQIVSVKRTLNIETYLQFLAYRKFWAHPFTYFILTLLNSTIMSAQHFVKIYMTFYDLKFKP